MKICGKTQQVSVTVFECLLCRILALALAGCDYEPELATARTLAQTLERGRR
jgi:hypothetical protein